jgi:hypothetical protein
MTLLWSGILTHGVNGSEGPASRGLSGTLHRTLQECAAQNSNAELFRCALRVVAIGPAAMFWKDAGSCLHHPPRLQSVTTKTTSKSVASFFGRVQTFR